MRNLSLAMMVLSIVILSVLVGGCVKHEKPSVLENKTYVKNVSTESEINIIEEDKSMETVSENLTSTTDQIDIDTSLFE